MTLDHVVRVGVEAAALAAAVALLCASVPRLRASHRAFLWWLVGAKLLVGVVPLPAVKVAALPATTTVAARAMIASEGRAAASALPAMEKAGAPSPVRVAGWVWLVCGALLTVAAIPDWLRVRRWVRAGRAVDNDACRLAIARARAAVGLRRAPRVLAVIGLEGPVATGLLQPTVLLPADDLERLSPGELEMTLAHEMAHVARGDLWLGLVPALARRIFFFHPAAWIAEREYAIAREAACDEAVLGRPGADPFAYGRLLLHLAMRRPMRTAIPMSPHSMLRRRLEMIESMVRRVPIGRAGWVLVAVAALAIVPVQLVAKESDDQRCLDIGSPNDSAYVITDGDSHSMCGDTRDILLADAHRKKGEDVVWFRVNGQDWIIRDEAVVARARQLFAKVDALGGQQATLGEQQGRLGEEQGRLGMQQGELARKQASLAQWRADVALREADEAEVRKQLAAADNELADREAAVDPPDAEGPDDIGARMAELGARMAVLSRRQAALGEQQNVLGERMSREIADARRALATLLETAMNDGAARRVD